VDVVSQPERRLQITDARTLAALSHPLRLRLLNYLMAMGPRTASQCAKAIGDTPSNCSYHLRQLAEVGLVARAEAHDGRERPWRPQWTGIQVSDELAGSAASTTTAALVGAGLDQDDQLARRYLRLVGQLDHAWRDASQFHVYGLRLTPGELTALAAALDKAIRPFIALTRTDAPADARPVHLELRAFLRPEAIVEAAQPAPAGEALEAKGELT
jgi:predicted transcriptional regulator